jgi:TusE/DsrC/DsvC family sulfur relay protein
MEQEVNKSELDEDGLLVDVEKWTKEVAEILAKDKHKLSGSEQRRDKMIERKVDTADLDEDGFLVDARKWTKEVAEILAQDEMPTGLTENHWIVMAFIRQYYLEFKSAPPIRMVARRTGFTLGQLKELFPGGLLNTAWKYAGLPRNAVRPYFMYPRGGSYR